ncbi:MAG: TolC family protein [Methylotenera sp.]|nr:TolC family protein [Methylotenera sp.]MDO9388529.1 TolC family protein [Methylotenera sp.]
MSLVVKLNLSNRRILVAVLSTFSIASTAGETTADDVKLRPTSTLSAAANAANSAVNAANAAAAAASAAANAAAAAVEAINAVLPPSQRIVPSITTAPTPNPNSQPSLVLTPPADAIATKLSDPLDGIFPVSDLLNAQKDTQTSVTMNGKFLAPSERSLVGLVGTFEIPVAADARGDFAAGIQSEGSEVVESVSSIDLAQAVGASLGFSRDVHIASARVDQAKAQTGQAKAFLLPSLLLSIRTGREQSSPGSQLDPSTGRIEAQSNHSRTDRSITLKQPLVDLPGLFDWKRREVVEKSREESVRASQGDAYLATVNAYLALVSSRVQASMALDYENQLQELFQYVEKRASAGAATNSDKERVRARSLNARAARIEQDAAQAAAGVEFVRLVNIAPASLRLPDMEDIGISIVPAELQQAISQAVESNPDIAVLKEELRAAQIDQTAVKGRFLPRLDLELSDTNIRNMGGASGTQHDQRMMLVMNWSILNGGSDLKLGNEKTARVDEINYRLDDQRRRVLQSLTAQYATLEATRQRITAGYSELDSISTAAKAMSNRMVSGNQSLLDMLDVYDRYYQARTRLVSLHVQEMGAVAQIARLVQGAPIKQGMANLQPLPDSNLIN